MVCRFCSPPLTPPPLSTPAGVERGALIWLRRAGYAPTVRFVATASSLSDSRAYGRRELALICTPRLAAAPASSETSKRDCASSLCLVNSRPRSGRGRGRAHASPLTTTAGVKCSRPDHGGDGSRLRSLSRNQTQNPGPLLYPGGGTKQRLSRCVPIRGKTARTRDRACSGRGDEWGASHASQTQKRAPE